MANQEQDFLALLDTPADDIAPPPLLPVGRLRLVIRDFSRVQNEKSKEWGYKFALGVLRAYDDVDAAQFRLCAEWGLERFNLQSTYYLTAEKANRLKTMLVEHAGISSAGKSLGQLIEASKGRELDAIIEQVPMNDKSTQLRAQISETLAPAD